MIDISRIEQRSLLKLIPKVERNLLIEKGVQKIFSFGEVIVREGDTASAFFIILEGEVRIVKSAMDGTDVHCCKMGPGSCFGEIGIISLGGKRSATVRASSKVSVLEISKSDFESLIRETPQLKELLDIQQKRGALLRLIRLLIDETEQPLNFFRDVAALEVQEFHNKQQFLENLGPGLVVLESGILDISGEDFAEFSLRTGDFVDVESCKKEYTIEPLGTGHFIWIPRVLIENYFPELSWNEQFSLSNYRDEGVPMTDSQKDAKEFLSFRDFPPTESKDFHFVPQLDRMDCGAACMIMVAHSFGIQSLDSYIRELSKTGTLGTDGENLIRAALELDIPVTPSSDLNYDDLTNMSVVHFEEGHWGVCIEKKEDSLKLADPAVGVLKLSKDQFLKNWSGYAIQFEKPTAIPVSKVQPVRSREWLREAFRGVKIPILCMLAIAMLILATQLLIPFAIQWIIDDIIPNKKIEELNQISLVLACATISAILLMPLEKMIQGRAALALEQKIFSEMLDRFLNAPLGFLNNLSVDDIKNRLNASVEVRNFMFYTFSYGLISFLSLLVIYGGMLYCHLSLAGTFLILVLPVYLILVFFSSKVLRPAYEELQAADFSVSEIRQDLAGGGTEMKASGHVKRFADLSLSRFAEVGRKRTDREWDIESFKGVVQILWYMTIVFFLWAGGTRVIEDELSLGKFIAFQILILFSFPPVMGLIHMWRDYLKVKLAILRITDLMNTRQKQYTESFAVRKNITGHLEAHNIYLDVRNRYLAGEVDNHTASFSAGSKNVLLAYNGVAPQVFCEVLGGSLKPDKGTILLDDIPIEKYDEEEIASNLSYTPEHTYLYHGSIEDNISMFDPECDRNKIKRLIQIVGIQEDILSMPIGLSTSIEQNSLLVSASLRQGIGICRALYKEPKVCILNAAIDAMDVEKRNSFFYNLYRDFPKLTLICFTRQVELAKLVDQIFVFDGAALRESGSEQELLALKGLYYHLVEE
ncbi:MAG: cyclic nucleotide-binding domain-containing protein [Lentisphaeria bacterium]|nr:cyclic nucleotide-binding domain-containing protein [Lentisphaeria bacterium]